MVRDSVPALVPARMINETLYCERLLYLEWAQSEFADNYFTADGKITHKRADNAGGILPLADSLEDRSYTARSVWLSSEMLSITAKIDIIEIVGGKVIPIEYKRGHIPNVLEGAYLPERAQLCAQVLLLREHGYIVDKAEIYFAASKKRVEITIDDSLITTTKQAVLQAKEVCAKQIAPPPLIDSPKCHSCSLVSICLPDETNALLGIKTEMRRLHPMRDDKMPLHVQEQGAKIGLRDDCLIVKTKEKETSARIAHTSGVSVYGNVQVSTQALRTLMYENIPVSFFTTGGWYCGRAVGIESKNIGIRTQQFKQFADSETVLCLAKSIVESKIWNCRTMLMRNGNIPESVVQLEASAKRSTQAKSLKELLGIEGSAAQVYFGAFRSMLKNDIGFNFEGRNRRPPRDPVNALLSFAYALLTKDFSVVLSLIGLDPLYGFYHQPRFNRPSLALDLMEEFRPIIADSVVITVINTGVIKLNDFVSIGGSVALSSTARREFIGAYERRMDQTITHPLFGYKISYRRVLEVQARLLSRMLLGEIATYPQFRVR